MNWNQFRSRVAGNGYTSKQVSRMWRDYKKRMGITSSNPARDEFNKIRSQYLMDLANGDNGLAPLRDQMIRALGPEKAEKVLSNFIQGRTGKFWTVHHIEPLYRGGQNVYSNFMPLRKVFHQKKSRTLHNYFEGYNPRDGISWMKINGWF